MINHSTTLILAIMLAIFGGMMIGASMHEGAKEDQRKEHLVLILHIIIGVMLLGMGVFMVWNAGG